MERVRHIVTDNKEIQALIDEKVNEATDKGLIVDKVEYGLYGIAHRCVACNHVLTDNQRMYNHGSCPFCGKTKDSTIAETKKVSIRLLIISFKYYWFLPFIRGQVMFSIDEEAKCLL